MRVVIARAKLPPEAASLRILFVTHRLPWPPDKGDRIRSWRWLDAMAGSHEVWLGAMAETGEELHRAREIEDRLAGIGVFRRPSRARAALGLLTGRSLSEEVFGSRDLRGWVERIAMTVKPDLAFGFSSTTAQFLEHLECPRFMDLVDVDSEKWSRYGERGLLAPLWRLEAERLRSVELEIVGTYDRVFAISREEAGRLGPAGSGVEVLPNGVDSVRFSPGEAGQRTEGSIVFVGAMDYAPNVESVRWFAHEVLPGIQRAVPAATFTIVGSNPTRSVRSLGRRVGVEVTGTVDDVVPHLRRACVAVAPLRIAMGVQNKVLEAAAAGLPVVATPGAVSGLDLVPGREVLVAEQAEEFAATVVDLLGNREAREALGRAAREAVVVRYRWEPVTGKLLDMIEEVGGADAAPGLETPSGEAEAT